MSTKGPSLSQLLPYSSGSIYKLVGMAAKRAIEIAEGKAPLIETTSDNPVVIALEEIFKQKVQSVK